jgi:hypothetical protein
VDCICLVEVTAFCGMVAYQLLKEELFVVLGVSEAELYLKSIMKSRLSPFLL